MLEGVFLMGILQGIVLIGIIYIRSHFGTSKSLLISLLVLISSMLILGQLLVKTHAYETWPILFLFISGLPFLIGPYLYFYVRSEASKDHFRRSFLLHHIPFVVFLIMIVYLTFSDFEGDFRKLVIKTIQTEVSIESKGAISIGLLKSFHLLVYTLASFLFLKRRNLKGRNLQQLVLLFAIGQLIFWILIFLRYSNVDDVFIVFQVIFLYLLGYQSILDKDPLIEKRKYVSSKISGNEIDDLFLVIKQEVEGHQLYLNADFSLKNLSQRMKMNEHQISQVINQSTGDNFSIFINNYRVDRVKKMMEDPKYDHLKLLSIALESGFNNKNSFNQHFKRLTGTTPSEYKKGIG